MVREWAGTWCFLCFSSTLWYVWYILWLSLLLFSLFQKQISNSCHVLFFFSSFSPLETGCSLYKLALTPSNLPLPACLLSHCPSHQWPAPLPALSYILSSSCRISRTTDFGEEHPHHENRRGNQIVNCVGCCPHADYCSIYVVYILNFFLL